MKWTPWSKPAAVDAHMDEVRAIAKANQDWLQEQYMRACLDDMIRAPKLADPEDRPYGEDDEEAAQVLLFREMAQRDRPFTPEELGEKGRKDDDGKVPLELLPMDALIAIAHILRFGAQKYQARNWEQGMQWGRVFGATLRHLFAWWQGKTPTDVNYVLGSVDSETKMSHLWHAGCCILFLIAYEARGMTEFDDRPGT